jgi:hypothetical protein
MKLTLNRDHFDQEVEGSLRRSLPIITTPHAKHHLAHKPDGESFTSVHELDTFQSMLVDIYSGSETQSEKIPAMKVTAMPGKHVPPGVLGTLNDLVKAVRTLPSSLQKQANEFRSRPQTAGC